MCKMITSRKRSSLLLSVMLLLSAAVAFGQPFGPPRHGPPPDERLERDLEKLGLDAGQMERVRVTLDASRQKRESARAELRTAFEQVHDLLESDTPDEAAIMRQVEKIGQLKTEEHKAMLRTLLQVRAELTPEQREKLKEMGRPHGPPPWRREHSGDAP